MLRVLATSMVILAVTPVLAADWPDLRGTWTGTTRAVVAGGGGHYPGSASEPKFVSVETTIEWSEQSEGRLIGTITSPNSQERKLGVIAANGEDLITVDEDGHSVGRVIDEDHFELCYTETAETQDQMIASCVVFERVR